MNIKPFRTSKLFDKNFTVPEGCNITINQGGTSSGKTYSIMQVLSLKALEESNLIITVTGQDIPNLKKGALRDLQTIISNSEYLQANIKDFNKTDRIYTFRSNSIIEFQSYDDSQDARNGKRDYLFVNEANGVHYNVFSELFQRTSKHTWLDYNPTAQFWIHERKIMGWESSRLLRSTYKSNPFISDTILKKILSYEPTKKNIENGTADEYRWKVYGLGEMAALEGVVFSNWKTGNAPKEVEWTIYGLDFGYTNDPTALIEIKKQGNKLYLKELIYETGLTNRDISKKLGGFELTLNDEIYADSAEPKSIDEIYEDNFNIYPALKGRDSILNGIDKIKQFTLIIEKNSYNLAKELQNYLWAEDKNGIKLNKPIDKFNHLLDALRYGVQTKLSEYEFIVL